MIPKWHLAEQIHCYSLELQNFEITDSPLLFSSGFLSQYEYDPYLSTWNSVCWYS